MKTHEECAALLDAFIDGELSGADADAVREHLAECEDCAAYVSDALAMRELFPALDETIVPDGFAESVIASLPPQITIMTPETSDMVSELQSAETAPESQIAPTAVNRWKRWINLAAPLAACVALVLLIHGFGAFRPKGMGAAAPESAMDAGGGAEYGATSSGAADFGADGAALFAATTADETASEETEESAPQDLYEYQVEESALGDSAPYGKSSPTPEPSENANHSAYAAQSAKSSAAAESEEAEARTAGTESAEAEARIEDETPPQSTQTTSETPETPSAAMGAPETPSEQARNASAAPTQEELDLDAESLSVWTLSANGAPLLKRYRPLATTERGAWYALTDAQFDALWDELINGEISATLEVSDATPPKIVPNAVYVLLSSD